MNIRPISDLRNHFSDIEKSVHNGETVFLTKNGYGSMVVMDLEQYSRLTNNVDLLLSQADEYARTHTERLSQEEVYNGLQDFLNEL